MSAFPKSGRSDTRKTTEMKVRLRPIADITMRFNRRRFPCAKDGLAQQKCEFSNTQHLY
jgi:hypothetical protein